MGNRAVIATKDKDIGIYLHWNGGRESVDAFLAYCRAHHYRSPDDDEYGWVCLAKVIANFFKNGLSCGINLYEHLDTNNGDNGVYIIKDWKIIGREYTHRKDKKTSLDGLIKFMNVVNDAQPTDSQLSKAQIEVNAEDYLSLYDNEEKPVEDNKDTNSDSDNSK